MAKPSVDNYEKLGRAVENILTDSVSKKNLAKLSFLKGIFIGLGATIGGTLGITILVWLLSHFTQLPVIGDFVETIENSLSS